jgi:hypothetical protein
MSVNIGIVGVEFWGIDNFLEFRLAFTLLCERRCFECSCVVLNSFFVVTLLSIIVTHVHVNVAELNILRHQFLSIFEVTFTLLKHISAKADTPEFIMSYTFLQVWVFLDECSNLILEISLMLLLQQLTHKSLSKGSFLIDNFRFRLHK